MRFARVLGAFVLAASSVIGVPRADATCPTETCTANGTTRQCDSVCGFPTSSGSPCTTALTDCNSDGVKVTCGAAGHTNYIVTGGGNDVICGRELADTIHGGSGNDTIFGDDGNDDIEGEGGTDVIEGGLGADTLDGGPANDDIRAVSVSDTTTNDGGNLIIGGSGDDFLIGAGGDDEIFGDTGNDTIAGQGARDVLQGGDDDDVVVSIYLGATPNDVLGSILCGGEGDDTLVGDGAGHQCLDGGTDQQVANINEFDCTYSNTPSDSDDHDVGTWRNCANAGSGFSSRHPSCGCE
jgi:Ca2+-binding RTX toxin-like protein